jgi:hypothetical protein
MNRLTADIFEDIVASLRSDKSRRTNEKRTRPRVGLRSSLQILVCPQLGSTVSTSMSVWVRDVSVDGLGLTASQSLALETQFIAEFERWDRQKLRVQYVVAHCKQLSRGLYSVGARLVKVLPERDVLGAIHPRARSA